MGMLALDGDAETQPGKAARPLYRDDEDGVHASRLQRLRSVTFLPSELADLERRLTRAMTIAGARWSALVLGHGAQAVLLHAGTLPDAVHRGLNRLKPTLGAAVTSQLAAQTAAQGCQLHTAPLLSPDGRLGTLILALPRQGGAAPAMDDLLALAADDLVGRIDAFAHTRQIDHIQGHLSLIHKLGQQLTTIHDQARLFQEISRLLRSALGYEHIQLLLKNEPGDTVELVHVDSPHADAVMREGCIVEVGHGIIGRVAQSGQLRNAPDVRSDAHFVTNAVLPTTASELALPLRLGQRVIGVLDIQSDDLAAFPRQDVILLQTIADQIAPAIEQNRLFAAERRERQLSATLADVSRMISSQLDPEHVLGAVLRELRRVVPYRGSRVTMRGEDGRMRVVAAVGYPDNDLVMSSTFRTEDTPLAIPVVESHETIRLADVRREPLWTRHPGTEQVVSWLAAPLVLGEACIGWLCVDWPEPGFFTADHERIVRAFTEQAVVAIENARLYDAARHLSDALEIKVADRTRQLEEAHRDISAKAEALRALWRRLVEVQETERQRIAHDLHDSAAQSILAATYQLQSIRRRVAGDPDLERRTTECQQTLDATHREMKQIIYALRPTLLDELGLVAALENHAAGLRRITGLDVTLRVSGTARALPAEIELAIYRVVQEACQNCVRHARAASLVLSVDFEPGHVTVAIADDGDGFDGDSAHGGLGLVSMRERSHAVGARLALETAPGDGTRIVFTLEQESLPA